MPDESPGGRRRLSLRNAALLAGLGWLLVIAFAIANMPRSAGMLAAAGAALVFGATYFAIRYSERSSWGNPVNELVQAIRSSIADASAPSLETPVPALEELTREVAVLVRLLRAASGAGGRNRRSPRSSEDRPFDPGASLTHSGLFDAPLRTDDQNADPALSGDYSTTDMVNRLDPVHFRWIESSTAEQIFLGYDVSELRKKSFLELLHHDDRPRAREMFSHALARGEALGLVVRMRTATGRTFAVEVNVGARYGRDHAISHLRCHLTDVTEKVRADRQLKVRTRELIQVNEQLRRINRELEELKDRYTDLYENAPAMYFTLDASRRVVECNQTLLATLGRSREQTVARPFESMVSHTARKAFLKRFEQLLQTGSLEDETRWLKLSGEVIDVFMAGKTVRSGKDPTIQARFVAQDVTTRRQLEAELHEKNERLALANEELSAKNRELDEFVHVVSHDLQEPLRTLTSFSDIVRRDFGDRLEGEGREYLSYIMDASRRMREMIHGMLTLSRAGRVIGDFTAVDLSELVGVVSTDLRELFRSRGAELFIKGELPVVWGDRGRLGHLLVNLISNGIKFNKNPRPRIEIGPLPVDRLGSTDGETIISAEERAGFYVKDDGIGIESQFHEAIFQLFRRLHTQEEFEGTGAGLAICGKIVQAHGGRIWVESAPGRGSTFFVRLRRPGLQASVIAARDDSIESPSTETAAAQMSTDEFNAL